jgi:hypothetical protein
MHRLGKPRGAAALATAASLAAFHAAVPDAEARGAAQYALVIAIGYGHLLAAARPRWRRLRARGALAAACAGTAAAAALAAYTALLARWPALVALPLAASLWHIVENDVAMARALRSGAPLRTVAGRARLAALAVTAALAGASLALLPDAGRFGDLFCAVTLYHLFAWLGFARARGARLGWLAAWHAGPALVCGGLWLAPEAGPATLRALVLSPGVYLFWSALHVLDTARRRA